MCVSLNLLCPFLQVCCFPPLSADLYNPERDGAEEPDWYLKEKEYFLANRDLNQNGYLDKVSRHHYCFFLPVH